MLNWNQFNPRTIFNKLRTKAKIAALENLNPSQQYRCHQYERHYFMRVATSTTLNWGNHIKVIVFFVVTDANNSIEAKKKEIQNGDAQTQTHAHISCYAMSSIDAITIDLNVFCLAYIIKNERFKSNNLVPWCKIISSTT